MNIKKTLLVVAVVLAGSFGYYAISPFFRDIEVDDVSPDKGLSLSSEVLVAEVFGTRGHPASGNVRIVEADGKKYVRYENFETLNGPDIYVYLSKDKEAKDFVSLGQVRGTHGNINYEIPDDVNPEDYKYVLTWCKMFGVLFNYADLENLKPQKTGGLQNI